MLSARLVPLSRAPRLTPPPRRGSRLNFYQRRVNFSNFSATFAVALPSSISITTASTYRLTSLPCANMPPSSEDDLFRLDPPKPFKYTDWVIRMPKPGIRDFLSPETAKQEYLANRLGLLITAVTARFGNDQCYFSEVSPHGSDGSVINKPVTKNPRHFEVTKLYAIHEVHHWPGAFGQLEWTHFVMANLEHDALCREYGPEANISRMVYSSLFRLSRELTHALNLQSQPSQLVRCPCIRKWCATTTPR